MTLVNDDKMVMAIQVIKQVKSKLTIQSKSKNMSQVTRHRSRLLSEEAIWLLLSQIAVRMLGPCPRSKSDRGAGKAIYDDPKEVDEKEPKEVQPTEAKPGKEKTIREKAKGPESGLSRRRWIVCCRTRLSTSRSISSSPQFPQR